MAERKSRFILEHLGKNQFGLRKRRSRKHVIEGPSEEWNWFWHALLVETSSKLAMCEIIVTENDDDTSFLLRSNDGTIVWELPADELGPLMREFWSMFETCGRKGTMHTHEPIPELPKSLLQLHYLYEVIVTDAAGIEVSHGYFHTELHAAAFARTECEAARVRIDKVRVFTNKHEQYFELKPVQFAKDAAYMRALDTVSRRDAELLGFADNPTWQELAALRTAAIAKKYGNGTATHEEAHDFARQRLPVGNYDEIHDKPWMWDDNEQETIAKGD